MKIKQALQSPIKTNQINDTKLVGSESKNAVAKQIDFLAADTLALSLGSENSDSILSANRKEIQRLYFEAAQTINSGDTDEIRLLEIFFQSVKIEDAMLKNYVSKEGCLTKEEEMKVFHHCLQKYQEYSE